MQAAALPSALYVYLFYEKPMVLLCKKKYAYDPTTLFQHDAHLHVQKTGSQKTPLTNCILRESGMGAKQQSYLWAAGKETVLLLCNHGRGNQEHTVQSKLQLAT